MRLINRYRIRLAVRLYRLIEWRVWERLERACAFIPDEPPFVVLHLDEAPPVAEATRH